MCAVWRYGVLCAWPSRRSTPRSATTISAPRARRVRGVDAFSDTNHKPEAAGMPRFRPDGGIFEDDGASRSRFEPSGRFQEHIRRQQPTLLSIVTQNTLLMTGQMVICGKADACAIRLSCTTTSHL